MAKYKLKDSHPTMEKLEKWFALGSELGISIDFVGRYLIVTDNEFPDKQFYMEDLENDNAPSPLPPTFEYKLTHER